MSKYIDADELYTQAPTLHVFDAEHTGLYVRTRSDKYIDAIRFAVYKSDIDLINLMIDEFRVDPTHAMVQTIQEEECVLAYHIMQKYAERIDFDTISATKNYPQCRDYIFSSIYMASGHAMLDRHIAHALFEIIARYPIARVRALSPALDIAIRERDAVQINNLLIQIKRIMDDESNSFADIPTIPMDTDSAYDTDMQAKLTEAFKEADESIKNLRLNLEQLDRHFDEAKTRDCIGKIDKVLQIIESTNQPTEEEKVQMQERNIDLKWSKDDHVFMIVHFRANVELLVLYNRISMLRNKIAIDSVRSGRANPIDENTLLSLEQQHQQLIQRVEEMDREFLVRVERNKTTAWYTYYISKYSGMITTLAILAPFIFSVFYFGGDFGLSRLFIDPVTYLIEHMGFLGAGFGIVNTITTFITSMPSALGYVIGSCKGFIMQAFHAFPVVVQRTIVNSTSSIVGTISADIMKTAGALYRSGTGIGTSLYEFMLKFVPGHTDDRQRTLAATIVGTKGFIASLIEKIHTLVMSTEHKIVAALIGVGSFLPRFITDAVWPADRILRIGTAHEVRVPTQATLPTFTHPALNHINLPLMTLDQANMPMSVTPQPMCPPHPVRAMLPPVPSPTILDQAIPPVHPPTTPITHLPITPQLPISTTVMQSACAAQTLPMYGPSNAPSGSNFINTTPILVPDTWYSTVETWVGTNPILGPVTRGIGILWHNIHKAAQLLHMSGVITLISTMIKIGFGYFLPEYSLVTSIATLVIMLMIQLHNTRANLYGKGSKTYAFMSACIFTVSLWITGNYITTAVAPILTKLAEVMTSFGLGYNIANAVVLARDLALPISVNMYLSTYTNLRVMLTMREFIEYRLRQIQHVDQPYIQGVALPINLPNHFLDYLRGEVYEEIDARNGWIKHGPAFMYYTGKHLMQAAHTATWTILSSPWRVMVYMNHIYKQIQPRIQPQQEVPAPLPTRAQQEVPAPLPAQAQQDVPEPEVKEEDEFKDVQEYEPPIALTLVSNIGATTVPLNYTPPSSNTTPGTREPPPSTGVRLGSIPESKPTDVRRRLFTTPSSDADTTILYTATPPFSSKSEARRHDTPLRAYSDLALFYLTQIEKQILQWNGPCWEAVGFPLNALHAHFERGDFEPDYAAAFGVFLLHNTLWSNRIDMSGDLGSELNRLYYDVTGDTMDLTQSPTKIRADIMMAMTDAVPDLFSRARAMPKKKLATCSH